MNYFSNRAAACVAAYLFLFTFGVAAHAGPIVIKMATIAPEGSSWHQVLQEMGAEWKEVSGGKVTLRIYPGGVVGDEDAMLRKMRVGQLHAAAITGLGLAFLDRSFYGLHVPMMYASDKEFDYVRDRLAPLLEKRLEEKGYVVLNWGDAGWVYFFAREPFMHPSEMKTMKLYIGAGISGAFNATPLAAVAFQWFALAPNMADFKWAPLTGATIIDKRAWENIPEELRPKILKVSRDASERLRHEIRNLNEQAMKAMVENGLKITKISPSVEAEWRKIVEDIYPQIRGKINPADVFDVVVKYRDEFRSSADPGRAMTR